MVSPSATARACTLFSRSRGDCRKGFPDMRSPEVTHPTSGFQGSAIRLDGSGIATRSGCAGERSKCAANPANPAPFACMSPIAAAGTSLARGTPRRSAKEIEKIFYAACRCQIRELFCLDQLCCRASHPASPLRCSPPGGCASNSCRDTNRSRRAGRESWRPPPSSGRPCPPARGCEGGSCRRHARWPAPPWS